MQESQNPPGGRGKSGTVRRAAGRVSCAWLAEHGYGSPEEFPEVDVLRSRM